MERRGNEYPNPVQSWSQLVEVGDYFSKKSEEGQEWAFRGQSWKGYPETTFERHCKGLELHGVLKPNLGEPKRLLEVQLIYEFARSYHLYSGFAPPVQDDILQWLSIMRHYGTPCRLLDFTYSFFIASFFACERLDPDDPDKDSDVFIWAVNLTTLNGKNQNILPKKKLAVLGDFNEKRDGKSFRELLMEDPRKFVCVANPLRQNERLRVQQGLFLIPGDVVHSFEANLDEVAFEANGKGCKLPSSIVHKVTLDKNCKAEVLKRLHYNGINQAALFPGLEGYAKSLKTKSLILIDLQRSKPEKNVLLDYLKRL